MKKHQNLRIKYHKFCTIMRLQLFVFKLSHLISLYLTTMFKWWYSTHLQIASGFGCFIDYKLVAIKICNFIRRWYNFLKNIETPCLPATPGRYSAISTFYRTQDSNWAYRFKICSEDTKRSCIESSGWVGGWVIISNFRF